MPTYGYICNTCSRRVEDLVNSFEDMFRPRCCGSHMRRDWSIAGVFYKGEGWTKSCTKEQKMEVSECQP